ncbi:fatty acyl-CoA reductase 1 isoform X1 [Amborella trichopoda]|uniref:fatty acyl-CoA reductase 1 isoform X1 n=1 Tax=Amborella trichopoda TaxID=13333 RepID=UPI0005D2EDE7|nr:fatty acyl-CoA reductase 1 isoform X1 [Amborella trichopoda]|eukprot:XP_011626024.1 fatty acyl-CoA reductase 1 isoform X1 [Amborella trichopoda]
MALDHIISSFQDKTILITGSTGYLAKIFVEKILRVQPEVKKLFLLIRASDLNSAKNRLHDEILQKELFKVLREKHGTGFDSFVGEKIFPVVGDLRHQSLGIKDLDIRNKLWREVDMIINAAAATSFDERYDVALKINTLGAFHVIDFAKKCERRMEVLLHVSTAYVSGNEPGLIMEKPIKLGETLIPNTHLDIDFKLKLVESELEKARNEGADEKTQRLAMKMLGLKRARLHGWPNTYTFTKAMGEMLMGHLREEVPVVIMRPSIIASTFSDPFPGWIEGARTFDSLIVNFAKGKVNYFLAKPNVIMDVIPGDMVVNAMIVAMATHRSESSLHIYHVTSSTWNPINYDLIADTSHRYFSRNPCCDERGRPIVVKKVLLLTSMTQFRWHMTFLYYLPLQILKLVNKVLLQKFRLQYNKLNTNYNYVMHLAELYEPYVCFKGWFDDLNAGKLRSMVSPRSNLAFDTQIIDWDDYFMTIHIPGLVKYVLK